MLDRFARRLIDPPLNAAGRAIAQRGYSADHVTLFWRLLRHCGGFSVLRGYSRRVCFC